jgi:uncharacterized protein
MNSLSFPDLNVWLALLLADHIHRPIAKNWWDSNDSDVIGFTRTTQIGVLRLLTTAAAMNGKPLTMAAAWAAYDRLFADDRVAFIGEPANAESFFREHTFAGQVSPKIWADAWLLAMADSSEAVAITFDRALAAKSNRCLL